MTWDELAELAFSLLPPFDLRDEPVTASEYYEGATEEYLWREIRQARLDERDDGDDIAYTE